MLEKLEINNSCVPCGSCADICPEDTVFSSRDEFAIDNSFCTNCGLCIEVCPVNAIKISTTFLD